MLYKVDVVDKRGALVSPTALEKQLEMIVEDADAKYGKMYQVIALVC